MRLFLLLILLLTSCTPAIERIGRNKTLQPDLFESKSNNGKLYLEYYFENSAWDIYIQAIDDRLLTHFNELKKFFPGLENLNLQIILINSSTLTKQFKTPDWVKAFYHRGRIFIGVEQGEPFLTKQLSQTLKHELTHAIIAELSGFMAPAWIDEGLAMYLESKPDKQEHLEFKALVKKNGFIPLKELNNSFTLLEHYQESRMAYLQSKIIIKYLFSIAGQDQISEYYMLLKNRQTNAFEKVFGISTENFESNFQRWVWHGKISL